MLSYYLLWHMNKALEPLREHTIYSGLTQNQIIESMKALQKCKLTIGDTLTDTIAEPNDLQQYIHNMVLNNDGVA